MSPPPDRATREYHAFPRQKVYNRHAREPTFFCRATAVDNNRNAFCRWYAPNESEIVDEKPFLLGRKTRKTTRGTVTTDTGQSSDKR